METNKQGPLCGTHRVAKEWRPATFSYTEDGITVSVSNIFAWVCPQDGEASFTPDTVDDLIDTVRDLLASAKRAQARRSVLTDYMVSLHSYAS